MGYGEQVLLANIIIVFSFSLLQDILIDSYFGSEHVSFLYTLYKILVFRDVVRGLLLVCSKLTLHVIFVMLLRLLSSPQEQAGSVVTRAAHAP